MQLTFYFFLLDSARYAINEPAVQERNAEVHGDMENQLLVH